MAVQIMPGREQAPDRAAVHLHLLFRHLVDRRARRHGDASPRGRPATGRRDRRRAAIRVRRRPADPAPGRQGRRRSCGSGSRERVASAGRRLALCRRASSTASRRRPNGKGMIYYAPSGDMMCQVSPGNDVEQGRREADAGRGAGGARRPHRLFRHLLDRRARADRHASSARQRAAGRHRRPRAPVYDRRRSADAQYARHELRRVVGTHEVRNC